MAPYCPNSLPPNVSSSLDELFDPCATIGANRERAFLLVYPVASDCELQCRETLAVFISPILTRAVAYTRIDWLVFATKSFRNVVWYLDST
jgi:hypothetical protein